MPEGRLERTRKSYAAKSMRELYNAAMGGAGANVPEVAVMNGGNLNQILGVTEYDPHEAYYVTPAGIMQIER